MSARASERGEPSGCDITSVASLGALEEALIRIYGESLAQDCVAIDDDYFALGGDSITAIVLLSKARERGIELQLHEIFECQTISALARRLHARLSAGSDAGGRGHALAPIERVSRDERLELSFAQQRMWFLSKLDGASQTYNMQMAWRIHGGVNAKLLERSLNEVVARHDVLRARFLESGGRRIR